MSRSTFLQTICSSCEVPIQLEYKINNIFVCKKCYESLKNIPGNTSEVYLDATRMSFVNRADNDYRIHSRALAAHCECLGMTARNDYLLSLNEEYVLPYQNEDFIKVMQKWGLINEKGEPLI